MSGYGARDQFRGMLTMQRYRVCLYTNSIWAKHVPHRRQKYCPPRPRYVITAFFSKACRHVLRVGNMTHFDGKMSTLVMVVVVAAAAEAVPPSSLSPSALEAAHVATPSAGVVA